MIRVKKLPSRLDGSSFGALDFAQSYWSALQQVCFDKFPGFQWSFSFDYSEGLYALGDNVTLQVSIWSKRHDPRDGYVILYLLTDDTTFLQTELWRSAETWKQLGMTSTALLECSFVTSKIIGEGLGSIVEELRAEIDQLPTAA